MTGGYCHECGAELVGGAQYCSECGAAQEDTGTVTAPGGNNNDQSSSVETQGDESATAELRGPWEPSMKEIAIAFVLSIIPAFILYFEVSMAFGGEPVLLALAGGWVLFGFLFVRHRPLRNMGAAALFWTGILFFTMPFASLVFTIVYAGQQTNEFAQMGGFIGGIFITIIAFVVGVAVGTALYLISRRVEVDIDEVAESTS